MMWVAYAKPVAHASATCDTRIFGSMNTRHINGPYGRSVLRPTRTAGCAPHAQQAAPHTHSRLRPTRCACCAPHAQRAAPHTHSVLRPTRTACCAPHAQQAAPTRTACCAPHAQQAAPTRTACCAPHAHYAALYQLGLTQMEEICSFLWCFLPAKLAKNTTEKEIFRSAEG